MGMVLGLNTIGGDNLKKVLETPALVWQVMAPDDPSLQQIEQPQPGFFAKLLGARGEPPIPLEKLEFADGELREADLDKSWHGIHYLLTGTAWEGEPPLNFILGGGEVVGDEDMGYGPARAFSPAQTAAIADALDAVSRDELASRFNPDDMQSQEIYPGIWDRSPEDDDTLGYCLEYFEDLKTFVRKAADDGLGLLVYIC